MKIFILKIIFTKLYLKNYIKLLKCIKIFFKLYLIFVSIDFYTLIKINNGLILWLIFIKNYFSI